MGWAALCVACSFGLVSFMIFLGAQTGVPASQPPWKRPWMRQDVLGGRVLVCLLMRLQVRLI